MTIIITTNHKLVEIDVERTGDRVISRQLNRTTVQLADPTKLIGFMSKKVFQFCYVTTSYITKLKNFF